MNSKILTFDAENLKYILDNLLAIIPMKIISILLATIWFSKLSYSMKRFERNGRQKDKRNDKVIHVTIQRKMMFKQKFLKKN